MCETRNPGLGGVILDIQRSIDDQKAPNSRWCCAVSTNARNDISYVIRLNMVIQVDATVKRLAQLFKKYERRGGMKKEDCDDSASCVCVIAASRKVTHSTS